MPLTKPQRKSVKVLYDRSPDGARSYREFRRRAQIGIVGEPQVVVMPWCNMFVCIEVDGHRHS